MPSRLQEHYKQKVVPALIKAKGYKNLHQVPKLEKIIVTMGVSTAALKADKTSLEAARADLAAITGQKPAINISKKSISNFNLRKGQEIGCRVTLRGQRMYEFFDRLVSAALPRVRDFRGVSNRSFDGRGNYTMGVADQTIFPEIELDKIKRQQGMDITLVTSAPTDEEAKLLLQEMGMPFAKPSAAKKAEATAPAAEPPAKKG
jgi:large subunit ribosomal protein L5